MRIVPICVLAISAFAGLSALAQSNSRATLSGTVLDPSEGVVRGAQVTVTDPQTGLSRQTKTDSTGFYRFDLLPPGDYDLTVEYSGFQKFVERAIPLQVGASATQDVHISPGTGQFNVDVVAEA